MEAEQVMHMKNAEKQEEEAEDETASNSDNDSVNDYEEEDDLSPARVLFSWKKRLLEKYPFNHTELDTLLGCYRRFRKLTNVNNEDMERGFTSLSLLLPVDYDDHDDDEEEDDKRKILKENNKLKNGRHEHHHHHQRDAPDTLEDMITSHLITSSPSHCCLHQTHLRSVRRIETTNIAPSDLTLAIVLQAVSSAFVIMDDSYSSPSSPSLSSAFRQIMDDYQCYQQLTSYQHHVELFLEGMAGAMGRRGPNTALRILYGACSRLDNCNNHQQGPQDVNTSNHGVDPTKLIDACYRLALASHILPKINYNNIDYDNDDYINNNEEEKNIGMEKYLLHTSKLANGQPPQSLVRSLVRYASSIERSNNSNNYNKNAMNGDKNNNGHDNNKATTTTTTNSNNNISLNIFVSWVDEVAPTLAGTISTFLHTVFFPNEPYPTSRLKFDFPSLQNGKESALWRTKGEENEEEEDDELMGHLPFTLACLSPNLTGKWHRLYTTEADGFAFTQLHMALIGYDGPTILLIRPTHSSDGKSGVFGYYTTSQWRESKNFYGESDCFLFRAEPTLGVYRPTGIGKNYMYLHPSSHSAVPDQRAHGLGFGGSEYKPRLFVTESFEECRAETMDATYEEGPLLPGDWDLFFDVDVLEVWGVGSDKKVQEAMEEGRKQRAVVEATRRKSMLVDKAQFLEDFKNETVLNRLFLHRHSSRGRHESIVDDDHGGYILEEFVATKNRNKK